MGVGLIPALFQLGFLIIVLAITIKSILLVIAGENPALLLVSALFATMFVFTLWDLFGRATYNELREETSQEYMDWKLGDGTEEEFVESLKSEDS